MNIAAVPSFSTPDVSVSEAVLTRPRGWSAIENSSQQLFLGCPLFEVLYEGTRGPGKTDTLIVDFAQFAGRGLGAAWRGILFRQTYPQLTDVITKSKKILPAWGATFNEAKSQWVFPGGEMLLLRQASHHDDYWNYHGHEYPWVGWEELCNWSDDVLYRRMMSTCRSSKIGVPRRYRATTNPYGPGHNWVKARWRLPEYRNRVIADAVSPDGRTEPPRVAIVGYVHENKYLLEADPEYIDRLIASARNESELKAWVYGSWDIIAGGMFDDVWNPRYNVVEPFEIPHTWRIDRSFDWGSSKPFSVGWWAESDGTDYMTKGGRRIPTVRGDLFRIGEWYGWRPGMPNEGLRMLAVDIAKGIVERELAMKIFDRVQPGPADSSIFTTENGVNIATDMAKPVIINGRQARGAQFIPADKSPGSRKMGWEMMRKMMKGAHHSENGPRENPGLFVFNTCHDGFLRTVPVLPRDDSKLDDVDTDAEDHVGDETRYRVRSVGTHVRGGNVIGAF